MTNETRGLLKTIKRAKDKGALTPLPETTDAVIGKSSKIYLSVDEIENGFLLNAPNCKRFFAKTTEELVACIKEILTPDTPPDPDNEEDSD